MDSTISYKFRIYPDAKRQSEIDLQLTLSKDLYNKLLEKSIDAYTKNQKFKIKNPTLKDGVFPISINKQEGIHPHPQRMGISSTRILRYIRLSIL